jgi:hypothetical protein
MRDKDLQYLKDVRQVDQIWSGILPSLHLAIDYSRIFSFFIHMMHFSNECTFGQSWIQNMIDEYWEQLQETRFARS